VAPSTLRGWTRRRHQLGCRSYWCHSVAMNWKPIPSAFTSTGQPVMIRRASSRCRGIPPAVNEAGLESVEWHVRVTMPNRCLE